MKMIKMKIIMKMKMNMLLLLIMTLMMMMMKKRKTTWMRTSIKENACGDSRPVPSSKMMPNKLPSTGEDIDIETSESEILHDLASQCILSEIFLIHMHICPQNRKKNHLFHILRHRAAAKARTLWSGLLPVEPAPVCKIMYVILCASPHGICKHILRMRII